VKKNRGRAKAIGPIGKQAGDQGGNSTKTEVGKKREK
jgi:hypothetical protein